LIFAVRTADWRNGVAIQSGQTWESSTRVKKDGALVSVLAYHTIRTIAGGPVDMWIPPSGFIQRKLFDLLGLGNTGAIVSSAVRVLIGGPISVYASGIDNRTQDPILIPALRN
jgi:hypothetical protein